jgi:hypothetical protein
MSTLHVSIVVDWEGEHLRDLDDLHTTRSTIEASLGLALPLTHFICPTYWLHPIRGIDPAKLIREHIRKGDEIALHVHCWTALVELAEQPVLTTPDWNDDGTGHGVPLGAYGVGAQAIIASARKLLETKLGATIRGFRCGGAMTSDCVYEALLALGFAYDCSAFPPVVVSQGFGPGRRGNLRDTSGARTEIAGLLVDLWGDKPMVAIERANSLSLRATGGQPITPLTQPYLVESAGRTLIEMPGNGGISDYADAGYMTKTFDTLLELAAARKEPMFFNIGCHQESAGRWKKPLMDFCRARRRELASKAVVISTVAKAARAARATLRPP